MVWYSVSIPVAGLFNVGLRPPKPGDSASAVWTQASDGGFHVSTAVTLKKFSVITS